MILIKQFAKFSASSCVSVMVSDFEDSHSSTSAILILKLLRVLFPKPLLKALKKVRQFF